MKKDCTTCKYGYEDERLGIPMCHHPKRFSEDCVDFNMHEEKHQEMSKKEQTILDEAAEKAYPIDISGYSVECRAGATPEPLDYHEQERRAFVAGAEWQKSQMMKNGNVILAEEDFNAEKEKSMEWGYNLCKQQMLSEAVEADAEVCKLTERAWITPIDGKKFHQDVYDNFKAGDKVRIIIVKEEEK